MSTNVFFTWLGPTQSANKKVNGIEGDVRPDLFGLLRTAKATFTEESGDPPPSFTLCCLKKYESAFQDDLPEYINTLALEDEFGTQDYKNILLTKPDLSDLKHSVDYITRKILGVQGTGYHDSALPYSKLAFVKDIWSLYCLWQHGGYHIDCGCYPDAKYNGTVNLPPPTNFGVPVIGSEGNAMPNVIVSFKTEEQSATLCGDFANLQIAAASFGVDVTKTGDSSLNRGVDVWLMRAPKKDPGIELALKFYIQGFFAMDEADFLNSQNYRNLVVSAAATGITRNADGLTGDAWKNQVIEAPNGDVASLGLRKVGFQSHAG